MPHDLFNYYFHHSKTSQITFALHGRDLVMMRREERKNTWAQEQTKTSNNSETISFWGETSRRNFSIYIENAALQIELSTRNLLVSTFQVIKAGFVYLSARVNPPVLMQQHDFVAMLYLHFSIWDIRKRVKLLTNSFHKWTVRLQNCIAKIARHVRNRNFLSPLIKRNFHAFELETTFLVNNRHTCSPN